MSSAPSFRDTTSPALIKASQSLLRMPCVARTAAAGESTDVAVADAEVVADIMTAPPPLWYEQARPWLRLLDKGRVACGRTSAAVGVIELVLLVWHQPRLAMLTARRLPDGEEVNADSRRVFTLFCGYTAWVVGVKATTQASRRKTAIPKPVRLLSDGLILPERSTASSTCTRGLEIWKAPGSSTERRR